MPPKKGRNFGSDPRISGVVEQLSGGYRTVGQMVYDVLKESIQSGAFAPGEWLRQESLATAIGVSRLPVRSALLQLESEGFVVFHPHRGARVRNLTATQIDEIYRLRSVLESHAIRLSMARMTPDRIAELREIAAELDAEPEGPHFLDLRVKFYRALYDADHNPMLVQMIEQLRSAVGRYLLTLRFDSHHGKTHSELIDKVADGDLLGAEAWVHDHLAGIRRGIELLAAENDAAADLVAEPEPDGQRDELIVSNAGSRERTATRAKPRAKRA